jgi:hypothetical protein
MRNKYERMIEELRKNTMNDKEFVQRELTKRIDELER